VYSVRSIVQRRESGDDIVATCRLVMCMRFMTELLPAPVSPKITIFIDKSKHVISGIRQLDAIEPLQLCT